MSMNATEPTQDINPTSLAAKEYNRYGMGTTSGGEFLPRTVIGSLTSETNMSCSSRWRSFSMTVFDEGTRSAIRRRGSTLANEALAMTFMCLLLSRSAPAPSLPRRR